MVILIQNARIINPASPHHNTVKDILVEDGIIAQIGTTIDPMGADEVIEGEDIMVSAGWVDLFATIGDPGFEHRESIASALKAAANGGFTKVVISPEAYPVVDGKGGVEYLLRNAAGNVVDALPLGAITKRLEGKELAEMYDMVRSGAVGVSNGKHTIANAKVMQVAMQYAQELKAPFYSFAEEEKIANGGQMHEGVVSTTLGLKGTPALAEELAVARDLYLARYTETALHFSHITTAGAVSLIREAKANGMKVTASVPVHHLLLTDDTVKDFDSNYKVRPPFRDQAHIDALWDGLKDGTIDAIISDHEPLEIEAKFMEFGQAKPGITALETFFPALLQAAEGRASLELLIDKLTIGPRRVIGLTEATITEGIPAELTLFSTGISWIYTAEESASLSNNSPLWEKELTGKAFAVINHGQLVFAQSASLA
jgi:dihydroorotase